MKLKNNKIEVSICCITYNHEDYIELALQGFLSQKTNFNFEILIHDDASSDKTADIIRKYENRFPEKVHCIYQTKNQHTQGKSVSKNLFSIAKGKYIALCEGDDFWITETKLQIQFDFMEENLEYSLCAHSGYNGYEDGRLKKYLFRPFSENRTVSTEEIIEKWLFPTASLFYRKNARIPYDIPFATGAPCGDYPLAIFLSLKGKVKYFDRPMCVYRNFAKGSLSTLNRRGIGYQLSFNSRIITMLENLDNYTKHQFHQVIMSRIQNYQESSSLLKERTFWGLINNEYFRNYQTNKKVKHILKYFFPKLGTIKERLHYYIDTSFSHSQRFSEIGFEEFCKLIINENK